MDVLFFLAVVTLLIKLLSGIDISLGGISKINWLKDCLPSSANSLPKVSIIIPAMNEAENIEEALTSVLSLEYPNIEVLVINDRSTDATSEILKQMDLRHPLLQVFNIHDLPEGWLGKNHALHFGAQQAKGEYLLFTDADIIQKPTALKLAISYMEEKNLDHLTIGPEVKYKGVMLSMLMMTFVINFTKFMRPWKAKDPKSKHYIGIGAYNLIRTTAYWGCGTLAKIAMRPDDDIKLGKLIKQQGFRQEYIIGINLVSVEWYSSVKEMINGLMKNSYAFYEYNILLVIAASIPVFIIDIWPFIGLCFTNGLTQILYGVIIGIIYIEIGITAVVMKKSPLYALTAPIGSLLMGYTLWRSAFLTHLNQGISWRGTHYPLDKLKSNRI